MKELARTYTHVHKIFNSRVSCLEIVEKNLNIAVTKYLSEWYFQKNAIIKTRVTSIQLTFLTVQSKPKCKNENTEYHSIFILFNSQVY